MDEVYRFIGTVMISACVITLIKMLIDEYKGDNDDDDSYMY